MTWPCGEDILYLFCWSMEVQKTENLSEAGVAQAPIVRTAPFVNKSVIQYSTDESEKKQFMLNTEVIKQVEGHLKGAGNVVLVDIEVDFNAPTSGLEMGCVLIGSNNDLPRNGWTLWGGYFEVSNAYNAGTTRKVNLIPNDLMSKQIQPKPADAPSPKIMVYASKGVHVSIKFNMHVNTLVMSHEGFQ